MKEFSYEGIFQGRIVNDTVDADNIDQAERQLKRLRIKVQKIKASPKPLLSSKKVKNVELLQFTKKLATMVKAGLPVLETIGILKNQTKTWWFRQVLKDIYKSLSEGNTIFSAFSNHPKVFDNIYLNMIGAGEQSGALDDFLTKLAEMIEKKEKIIKGLKKAFTYPVIVVVIALGISVFMLMKVIPIFQEMYAGMGVDLPGFTQLLINISEFLRTPSKGGVFFVLCTAFFIGFRTSINKSYFVRKKWHALTLKLPLFGPLILKSAMANLSLVMANLLRAGVPVVRVLEICTQASNNVVIQEGVENVKREVLTGQELSSLFGRNPLFPQELPQLMAVGERTGQLDEMLSSIANFYEEEFDSAVATLSAAIEPIMIVLVGGIVATLLLGMYLPIFSAGDMFSQ